MSKYQPALGGHAGGHLRDYFTAVVTGEFNYPGETYDHHGEVLTVERITGLLWNCTDVMPGGLCDDLDLPGGSSYAQGARCLRKYPELAAS